MASKRNIYFIVYLYTVKVQVLTNQKFDFLPYNDIQMYKIAITVKLSEKVVFLVFKFGHIFGKF